MVGCGLFTAKALAAASAFAWPSVGLKSCASKRKLLTNRERKEVIER
jgi:hypothetical protein